MANYVQQTGQLTALDGQLPSPSKPTLTTRYDDYILTSSAFNQAITVRLTSADPGNYDPVLQVYQLASGQDAPLANQSTVAENNDKAPGNRNSEATFNGGGAGIRYLVRVTSFNPMPDTTTFPATGTLPANYFLESSVPLGDITLTAKGGVTPGPNGKGTPVHRFWDGITQVHFYTTNQAEINTAIAQSNPITGYPKRDEYNSFIAPVDGNADIIRFLNPKTSTYFYTSGAGDMTNAANLGFVSQGAAFKSFNYPAAGTIPVYRFVNQQQILSGNVVHFFTPNEVEKNSVIATLGTTWKYEGIGFYAYPLG
jgi:hypothetical protein